MEDKEKLTDEHIKDLIRMGWTSKEVLKMKKHLLAIGDTEENVKRIFDMCKTFEEGKLKITCTEEDKKRIIKGMLKDSIENAGWAKEEARKDIEEGLKDGSIKFIE